MARITLKDLSKEAQARVIAMYPDISRANRPRRLKNVSLARHLNAVQDSSSCIRHSGGRIALRLDGARIASENVILKWNPWDRNRYASAWRRRIAEAFACGGPYQPYETPVSIVVTRVTPDARVDIDNISPKALIDGLRDARVIPDDAPRFVRRVLCADERGPYAAVVEIFPFDGGWSGRAGHA